MKIVILLGVVWFGLMGVAAFGAITGNTSLLVIAIVAGIPLAFLISILMRQQQPK